MPGQTSRHGALKKWLPPPQLAQTQTVEKLSASPTKAAYEIVDYVERQLGWKSSGPTDGTLTQVSIWQTLEWCQGALREDLLITAVQALENDFDAPPEDPIPETVASVQPTHTVSEVFHLLWPRIEMLSFQRASSILLGSLFGEVGIEAFVASGAASSADLAKVLRMEESELVEQTLPELPWDDEKIARHLHAQAANVRSWRHEGKAAIAKGFEAASRDNYQVLEPA
jgi:hypothetical protein